VLVYWLAPGDGPLQDELGRLQRGRVRRNEQLIARLQEHGLPITYDEIAAEAKGDGIGRPHVAAVLVRKGIVGSIQEAFDTWLAKGQPGYVDRERLLPADALRLALASGAVPVLAHPLSLGLEGDALAATVGELRDAGLAGIEAIYGRYTPDQRGLVADMGKTFDLVVTGGSDYHGTYKPGLHIGVGTGDLDVADDTITKLAERKP
jgi:3',5'-nucleoside bisphosphate phosphatase